ncbi:MAG: hypothetical protein ACI4VM_08045, partial [Anaerovoracaceae bacterium]
VVVFPRTFEKYSHMLQEDRIVIIRGTLQMREEETPKLLANSIEDIHQSGTPQTGEQAGTAGDPYVRLQLPADRPANMLLAQIREVLSRYPGEQKVIIRLADGRRIKASETVRPCHELFTALESITGKVR